MHLNNPKISQNAGSLPAKDLEIDVNAVFLIPKEGADFRKLPYGDVLRQRMRRARYELGDADPFVTELPNRTGTRLVLVGIDAAKSGFELLSRARAAIGAARRHPTPRLLIACFGLEDRLAARACEAVVAAALAADMQMPSYKSKPDKTTRLRELRIYGHRQPDGYARTRAAARGNNLARYLTALPPNELTPGSYRRRVEQLAREYRWKREFLDMRKLKARGAGAFLAVVRGSAEPDAGILHLRYTPAGKSRKPGLALVGKGICFDTGGTNLKTARHMHGMHEDMEGSAVALGTLLALTELKVDFPVDCWLALAQNQIGPRAYKQNEVVRAANGKTIEVVHTDAEGRMILADTLYLASRAKPRLIVDYATLTGACVGALSTRMSGAFTNRPGWIPILIEAGEESGERVWPFPLPEDYEKPLKSDIADIKQCTLDSEADHILAGVFLKKFLDGDPAWIHVDLAAGNHKGGLAHIPTDITGFGVRFTLSLLLDQNIFGSS